MAWTAPSTWVSGAILTAAQLNEQLRDNMLAAGPIYTNEAARDAAITSPFEGQRAYLTAPTVPAATGATTAVPTGVTTIYNGTAWVCVTPVGAYSNTTGSSTTTSYYTTLTGDTTAITVTLVTGTTALLQMSAVCTHGTTGSVAWLSIAVSGATTLAASDSNAAALNVPVGGYNNSIARTLVLSGLTAGTNTFTLSYKGQTGTTTWTNRNLTVQGVA